jgi:hypothetical protein
VEARKPGILVGSEPEIDCQGLSQPDGLMFFTVRNRKMRILFIEPKSPAEHVFSLARIPRLGSVLLATMMRDRGHRVRVVVEEIGGEVTPLDLAWSQLIAISTITSAAPRAYAIGDEARRLGKKVVLGGPHVTFLPDEALAHGHFVVRGEGRRDPAGA